RDELRAVCRTLSLDDRDRARAELAARILGTTAEALSPARAPRRPGDLPRAGDIVHARHRQYLVSDITASRRPGESTRVAMVWTGPETRGSGARDTAVVVREMFEAAERHVLIAGYSFERGEGILAPLHAAMRDRGVRVEMFVHLREATGVQADPEVYLRAQAEAWRRMYWSFGTPLPTLYVDPRAATAGSYASLHAKCIVVDGERALVGSANFTDRGQSRNIEAGVLVEDARFAEELARQGARETSSPLHRRHRTSQAVRALIADGRRHKHESPRIASSRDDLIRRLWNGKPALTRVIPSVTPTGSEQSPCPDPPADSIEMCIRSRDAA
ncbi:MAG: DISARM system phospholipase D-like protein DrmC, partial [Deltaproteobacteria bacterium]|nr:DISARM system phospholipase D-like protein DrmC [Deltaproteobacteria bacterium]